MANLASSHSHLLLLALSNICKLHTYLVSVQTIEEDEVKNWRKFEVPAPRAVCYMCVCVGTGNGKLDRQVSMPCSNSRTHWRVSSHVL